MSCHDGTGPDAPLVGHVAIVPLFESSAAGIVPVERLHVTLLRFDSTTVAADDTLDIDPSADSVDVSVEVVLLAQSEQFFLEMELIDPAGNIVFQGGPTVVTASSSAETAEPVEVVFTYTGVGSRAVDVVIATRTAMAFFGETVVLAADALDGVGDPIPGTPIKWSSVDAAAGTFPDDESGSFVAGSVRGPALVAATLLTGPADTAAVLVQPLPTAIAITGGNDQMGPVGTALPLPLGVTVTASDGLGVEAVEVVFAVQAGNGSLSATSVFTDAQGQASVTWTLGTTPGPMQATAAVPAAGGASVTFDATAQAIAFQWINVGGGNWSDPASWDLGAVPGSGSTVNIDLDGTYTVALDVAAAVDVLNLGAATGTQRLVIGPSVLDVNVAGTVGANGVIDLAGSLLGGAGSISINGVFKWTGGTIDGAGVLRIENFATMTIGGTSLALTAGRTVENHGTVTWATGDIVAADGSAFINASDGTFDVQGDVLFSQGAGAASLFDNLGPFNRTVGTGIVAFTTQFDNAAQVDVQTGVLRLDNGGASSTGTFTTANGAALQFGGGSHTVGAVSLAPSGILDVLAGTVDLVGNSTLTGNVAVSSPGTLIFNGGASTLEATSSATGDGVYEFAAGAVTVAGTYAVTGTSTHITGGTVLFNNAVTPATTTALTMSAGTLGGVGQFQILTALDWTGGTMTGSGLTFVGPGSTGSFGGGPKNLDGRAFFNAGVITWTAGDIASGNGAVFTNAGTLDVQGDVSLQFSLGGTKPLFDNTALLNRTVGTGIFLLDADLDNQGTVDIQTGALDLIGAYTQGASAVLTGSGAIDIPGDVVTSGTINMAAGTLKVGGVLNPTGTFTVGTVVFQGTGPQIVPSALTPYNNVEVTGQAEIDGSLDISGTLLVSGSGFFTLPSVLTAIVNVTGDVTLIDNGMLDVGGTGTILNANADMLLMNNSELYIGLSGGVFITGDYTSQDLSSVRMGPVAFDELSIGGNATFGGGPSDLTGGIITFGGNFAQLGDPASFAPTGPFTVNFSNACSAKTINFADPVNSWFSGVNLFGSAVVLETDADIRGNLTGNGDVTETGGPHRLDVSGDVSLTAGACANVITLGTLSVLGSHTINTDLTVTTLEIGNVLTPALGAFSATNTVFLGLVGPQNIPILTYNNVEVTGDVQFSDAFGSQTVGGDLVVSGNGLLNTEMTDVTVGGNFRTQDNGVLMMMYDSSYDILRVTGDVEFGGGSTAGLLTEGEMYVGGNFTQLGTNDPESFHAGGGSFFDVYFEDTPTRTIFFETPGIGIGVPLSHFEDVGFLTNGTVTLNSDVFAHGNLNSSVSWNPTLAGNGNKLAAGGAFVDGMTLDNVLLELNGTPTFPSNGTLSRFDNVTFQNYNTTDVQFTILHPGAVSAFELTNLRFLTTPTGAGRYLSMEDSDPLDANVLTVYLTNPLPNDPGVFVTVLGGAVLAWPFLP